jgi:hypothetical protein
MNTALETAKESFLTPLLNAPLIVAVAVGLLAFGWLLKLIPKFPTQWIPACVIVAGGAVGFFVVPMQGPGDWAFQVSNPEVADVIRRVGVGLAVGVGVFVAHKYGIKKLEKKLAAKFGNGDTSHLKKPEP